MKKLLKNLSFSLIIFIFFLEFISFFLNKFDNTEIFKTRAFTEKTDDARIFTLKKDISYTQKEIYQNEERKWEIHTSKARMRIGKNYKITSNKNLFLFLGDSVPFGWGVNYENSVPFYFQKSNKNLSILNGAVPSYSLAQSVERFFIEFKNIENLEYVYLQIYGPAPIYGLLGKKWEIDDNYATLHKYIFRENNMIDIDIPLYGEPYFSQLLKKKIYRIKIKKLKQIKASKESEIKYLQHIDDNLNKLYEYLNKKKIKLILSPIAIPDSTYRGLDKQNQKSITLLNNKFKNFASNNTNVQFLDVMNKLIFNNDHFIDKCCHLSKSGASLVADEIKQLIY